jgi:hypothetical protein
VSVRLKAAASAGTRHEWLPSDAASLAAVMHTRSFCRPNPRPPPSRLPVTPPSVCPRHLPTPSPPDRRNPLLPAQAGRRQRRRPSAPSPSARGSRRAHPGCNLLARDGAGHHVRRRRGAVLVGRSRSIGRSPVEAAAARVGRRGAAGALLVGWWQHTLYRRCRWRGLPLAPPTGEILHGQGRAGQQDGRSWIGRGKHHGAGARIGSESHHRGPLLPARLSIAARRPEPFTCATGSSPPP